MSGTEAGGATGGVTGGATPRRVLVGFAESLAAIETVWCLLEHGHRVVAFTRAGTRPAIGRDPRVQVVGVPAPEEDLAATVKAVADLVARTGSDTLMPLDDASVMVVDAVGRSEGCVVAGAVDAAATLAIDKRRQLEAARAAGLAVPDTLVVEPGDVVAADDVPPGEAWVVKPALALAVEGGRVGKGETAFATTRDDVLAALAGRSDPVLVQPHLRGVGRGVFGFGADGRVWAPSGHERVRMMNPSGSGSSACRSWTPPADLVGATGRFVRDTAWDGLFMLEFLADDAGRCWFMELNGRTWGSLALAERRGLHYPAWAVAHAHDAAFRPPVAVEGPPVVARHLGRELVHLAFVARGRHRLHAARRAGVAPEPGLSAYPSLPAAVRRVASWGPDDRLYHHRPGRLRVLGADTWNTLAGVVPRRGRSA